MIKLIRRDCRPIWTIIVERGVRDDRRYMQSLLPEPYQDQGQGDALNNKQNPRSLSKLLTRRSVKAQPP